MTLRRSSKESLLIIEYVSEAYTAELLYSLITTAEELLDYLSHTQAPDAALRAIHVLTPHHRAKWHAYHMQQPTVRPGPALQHVPRPMEAVVLHLACDAKR